MKQLNTRTLVLLGILIVLILYYLVDSGIFSGLDITIGDKSSSETVSIIDTKDIDNVYSIIRMASVTEFKWDGGWDRDPFYYLSPDTLKVSSRGGLIDKLFGIVGPEGIAGFDLTGISWHGNSGYAIINGSIVKEGDVIGGFKVDKIALNYVIMKQGAQTIRLLLSG
ncbi:MAG: hypothetical protein ISR95_03355 [Candidatus Marinimicrobia bacterium]|nr:hypothetical protein [Candidatus Neomarinimicrobiota bacterium]MBL7046655.1 hypothetical protein [Candidatus Neomarinimicrobiota bacterium]